MGEQTGIEWTDHTFNPWRGCTKVSPGCANCYAEKLSKRNPKVLGEWGPGAPRVPAAESYWLKPAGWNRRAARRGVREWVFCASLSDWLDDDGVPIEWLATLLGLIQCTPDLDWLLLTKRPQNFDARMKMVASLPRCAEYPTAVDLWTIEGPWVATRWLSGHPPKNVWVGTSVEDQQRADERIPRLLEIPAAVRFLSMEPLLGPVDIGKWAIPEGQPYPDWIIVGGESGPGARPMHPDWGRSLRDQCQQFSVAFFFKQWGAWAPCADADWHGLGPVGTPRQMAVGPDGSMAGGFLGAEHARLQHERGWRPMARVGKKAAGRLLDGREHNELPSARRARIVDGGWA